MVFLAISPVVKDIIGQLELAGGDSRDHLGSHPTIPSSVLSLQALKYSGRPGEGQLPADVRGPEL